MCITDVKYQQIRRCFRLFFFGQFKKKLSRLYCCSVNTAQFTIRMDFWDHTVLTFEDWGLLSTSQFPSIKKNIWDHTLLIFIDRWFRNRGYHQHRFCCNSNLASYLEGIQNLPVLTSLFLYPAMPLRRENLAGPICSNMFPPSSFSRTMYLERRWEACIKKQKFYLHMY